MIPSTFCWTKMGVESGEDLALIIRRKEWERQLGDGLFFWGIGQSLGENARDAAASIDQEMKVLFSPMSSKAKDIDVTPGDVFVWNSWIDSRGNTVPLPQHVLITSRADLPSGRRKSSHYALVCKSADCLGKGTNFEVTAAFLRNFSSDKPLGASQVTAVVKNAEYAISGNVAKKYAVSFVATMEAPYSVQLSDPELLMPRDLQAISEVTAAGDVAAWNRLVSRLRTRRKPEPCALFTLDLFGADHGSAAAV
ncbi:hypothetical protein NLO83_17655 [Pseudomonas tremae]|uniref:hypothetical protein n=1 Tax=Pseudomonas syringae group TaxID=136849 RepID=UPI0005B55941|nr:MULTISPECIES: hypothetical protein [Pseudomonas syringae group]MCQ3017409.1 hypothetical protein [Pseudomonas tremae]QGL59388.1 hypothetical protein POR16_25180 [Pseudomonas coronafaciens pv. oryzae str. 1_6]RMM34568.1 hypothetical protein ALQ80_02790 [Pseudomonas coronafaciens pv. oryzae]